MLTVISISRFWTCISNVEKPSDIMQNPGFPNITWVSKQEKWTIIMETHQSHVRKLQPAMLCRKETLSHVTRYQCVSCRKSFTLPWQLKRHRMLLCTANGCYGNNNLLLEGSSCGRSECEFHARGKPCRISCFIQVKKVCFGRFHQFSSITYNT